MEGETKTAEEIISPFVYGNYDNPDDASGLPEGDYIEESKCLEAMKIYAKQESEKAVRELFNKEISFCTGCGRCNLKPMGLNSLGEKYLSCCPDANYLTIEQLKEKAVNQFKDRLICEIQGMILMGLPEVKNARSEGYNDALGLIIEKLK